MIATVGFDEPTIRNVILNFSTLSLAKYLQTCGRGGRKLSNKDYFNILDLGGNHVSFGDWNDDRDWEYIFNNPPKPGEGIAPKKTCPECEGLVHASSMKCPLKNAKGEDCLYEFEKKKDAKEKDLEEMILITKGVNLDEIIGLHNKKYEYYVFFELGVDVVKSMLACEVNITEEKINSYFKIYYLLCCQWWTKTMANKNGNIISIEDSTWHITRAKNNFYSLYEKYKTAKIINLNLNEPKLKFLG